MISVENSLYQKFPKLKKEPLLSWPIIKFLRFLCHESEFKRFEQQYPHLKGADFVEQVLAYFDFSYAVRDRELERIPSTGKVVIVANHPIGSLDGLALLKLVGSVRSDVKVVANEILYRIEPLRELLLPVDNMTNKTRKNNIKAIHQHLADNKALIIFPAGEVSRASAKGVRDGSWSTGFLRFAGEHQAPILPIFVDGKNSLFFYALSVLAKPLSSLFLVREMFKQSKQHINVRIGHLISPEHIENVNCNAKHQAKLIKRHVYALPKNKGLQSFVADIETVAHPEKKQALKKSVQSCELLGKTSDGLQIYLAEYKSDSSFMREIGRLRELTFREVKEGTGKRRDIDCYDAHYQHLVLWDDENLELVGAYRMRQTKGVRFDDSPQVLYSQSLFNLQPGFQHVLNNGLELGRSFVQPAYQNKRSLDYLWQGIGTYLKKYPDIRYLFGPVSISQSVPDDAKSLLVDFYSRWFAPYQSIAFAKTPYVASQTPLSEKMQNNEDYREAFQHLKKQMKARGGAIPPLYKQYTELCENGGVQFTAFNVDADFSNCVDGLIVVDLAKIKPNKRERYL